MKLINIIIIAAVAVTTAGCSKLSPEAREITGRYYIPEVSADVALMELNDDATCVMRAVKPEVIVYEVPGTWDVRNDSIVMTLYPERLSFEGDSTLIGNVASSIKKHITDHTDLTLTLEDDGIEYTYQRKKQ